MLGLLIAAAIASRPPVIDMHFHALAPDDQGPPPVVFCAPYQGWPILDTAKPVDVYLRDFVGTPNCRNRIVSPLTAGELAKRNVAALERNNVVAVASGTADRVEAMRRAAPARIIPALQFGDGAKPWPTAVEIRALHKAGRLKVLGEITAQYDGIAPNDPRLEPYYALAEELDLPVGIHIGPGPPGVAYFGSPKYRMKLSDPLLLEDVLVRHPKLRLYVMHAGWPNADAMIGLMFSYPQVYCDVAVIDTAWPPADFYAYLRRLVDAGLARRILFGSDQMVWPEAIDAGIASINGAPFLSAGEKRDILYNNAVRFLRLTP